MAAVGSVQGDKRGQKSVESAVKSSGNISEMCKRNGVSPGCHCSDRIMRSGGDKHAKGSCFVKINGKDSPTNCRPNRSDKRYSSSPPSARKKRRSPRIESQEALSLCNGKQKVSQESQDRCNNNHSLRYNGDLGGAVRETSGPLGTHIAPQHFYQATGHRSGSQRHARTASQDPHKESEARPRRHSSVYSQTVGNESSPRAFTPGAPDLSLGPDPSSLSGGTPLNPLSPSHSVFHSESEKLLGQTRPPVSNGCRVNVTRLPDSALQRRKSSLTNGCSSPASMMASGNHSNLGNKGTDLASKAILPISKPPLSSTTKSISKLTSQAVFVNSAPTAMHSVTVVNHAVAMSRSPVAFNAANAAADSATNFAKSAAAVATYSNKGSLQRSQSSTSLLNYLGGVTQPSSGRSTPTSVPATPQPFCFQAGRASSIQSSDSEQKPEESALCRWNDCGESMEAGAMTEHLRMQHVQPQFDAPRSPDASVMYKCEWQGCKVHGKPSSSRSWLDRHILTHSGEKPFRCIVEGCGQRFSSQFLLERHVNGHFNQDQTTGGRSLRRDDTPSKHLKKKKVKRKVRMPVKRDDYVDSRIMEGVKHQLTELCTQDILSASGKHVTFHSTVIARRSSKPGATQVLLSWSPPDILPDQWVDESQAVSMETQRIPACLLSHKASKLNKTFYASHRHLRTPRK